MLFNLLCCCGASITFGLRRHPLSSRTVCTLVKRERRTRLGHYQAARKVEGVPIAGFPGEAGEPDNGFINKRITEENVFCLVVVVRCMTLLPRWEFLV